jgi:predicted nuclease of predicted toxin-antitoxin system
MRFLADRGASLRSVEWLLSEGHEVTHLREEGLQRMPNGNIFEKAAAEGRAMLIFDLDLGENAALAGGRSVSVILFRLHNRRTPHAIDRLRKVFEESHAALERGAVIVAEEARHRIRRCPFTG